MGEKQQAKVDHDINTRLNGLKQKLDDIESNYKAVRANSTKSVQNLSKGIENLIEAFSIIRDKKLDIKLWLVGEPDYGNISSVTKEYLENAISVNKNIEWKGKVSNIKKIWKNSHIAVLPSKREGLPLSLLEAAACGKPIVASDVPGCREIAISGFNAILFDVDNIVQLADSIIYLSLQHKLRKDFGINSRSLVEKDMSEKEVIQETIKVYENLLV